MFKLSFNTSNAAFIDYGTEEVKRILLEVAEKVQNGITEGKIIDINGNRIGKWELNEE